MKKIEFLERARNTHGYKYNYLNLGDKITLNEKIEIEFNNQIFIQSVNKHLLGRCPEKKVSKKTTEEFIIECKKVWGDKYDYSLVEYTGALSSIKIIYDGIVYHQRAKSHLEGMAPEFRKNEDSILRDFIKKSDFYGEIEIENFLNKYELKYTKNYLNFDFYLPKIRYVIEFDGRQHFEPISDFGGTNTFYKLKKIDDDKNRYCEDNFINIIRIKYDQLDDLYMILWNNLKNYIKK